MNQIDDIDTQFSGMLPKVDQPEIKVRDSFTQMLNQLNINEASARPTNGELVMSYLDSYGFTLEGLSSFTDSIIHAAFKLGVSARVKVTSDRIQNDDVAIKIYEEAAHHHNAVCLIMKDCPTWDYHDLCVIFVSKMRKYHEYVMGHQDKGRMFGWLTSRPVFWYMKSNDKLRDFLDEMGRDGSHLMYAILPDAGHFHRSLEIHAAQQAEKQALRDERVMIYYNFLTKIMVYLGLDPKQAFKPFAFCVAFLPFVRHYMRCRIGENKMSQTMLRTCIDKYKQVQNHAGYTNGVQKGPGFSASGLDFTM